MLYAFIIIDKSGFPVFEHFNNPNATPDTNTNLMKLIDSHNEIGSYKVDELSICIQELNEKFNVAVICSIDETLGNSSNAKLAQIGKNVLRGDKLAIQKIFRSSTMSDLI